MAWAAYLRARRSQNRALRAVAASAWGGGDAINNVVKYLGPGFHLVSFDPKTSISMVGREALADEATLDAVADLASMDVMTLNQEACVASRYQFVEGSKADVDRFCALARQAAAGLAAADGVEVLNDVVLNQVLVRFGDDDQATRDVITRVQEAGTCWVGGTVWQGRAAMRFSVSNWSTEPDDIDRSVTAILGCHPMPT